MQAVILSDRVSLELGEYIDWESLDNIYNKVFGGPEKYLETIMIKISENVLEHDDNIIKSLSDAVIKNFTNIEVLRQMGLLFLRRAESLKSNESVQDCEKSYAIFNACRILDVSFHGNERPNISFGRARAVQIAAQLKESPNPFQANRDRYKSLLHLAYSRMQSASEHSVGGFYKLLRDNMKEISSLRKKIGGF